MSVQGEPLNDLMTLDEAAKLLPGQPHVSTLHRWRGRGIRGVRLTTVRIGGRRYVSRTSLEQFAADVTAASDLTAPHSHAATASRLTQMSAAERELNNRRV